MLCRAHIVGWLAFAASVVALPRHAAAAESADECADAYELTQAEQKSGRLFDARRDARLCAARCPPRLASDCAAWETGITAKIPSFVVRVHGSDGGPLAFEVRVDGVPAVFTETGAIEAEPGPHRLLVLHAGLGVETHVDLVAGVRNQLVELTIVDNPPILPPSSSPSAPRPAADHPSVPLWRWVLGGLGLAAVATGAAISISGEVEADQLRGSCKPNCSQAQVDDVVQRWIIGGTVMGVGGPMLLTALLWPGARPVAPPSGRGPAARVLLGPTSVTLEGAF